MELNERRSSIGLTRIKGQNEICDFMKNTNSEVMKEFQDWQLQPADQLKLEQVRGHCDEVQEHSFLGH